MLHFDGLGSDGGACYKRSVQTLPAASDDRMDIFSATRWSVIIAARETQADAENSEAALTQLCQIYWPPLYAYARGRGYSVHDAQDLTQSFFAYALVRKIYKQADRQKGKFRSFLLTSFKNFLNDAHDRAATIKRGGGREFIPLDEVRLNSTECLFQTHSSSGADVANEDRLFERSWAETLIATTLERLAASYRAEKKERLFEQLKSFLTVGATPLPTYADLAGRLAIAESTLRSHVTRLRARYREVLRAEIRSTVNTDAEVDEELRELLRVLSNA